MVTITCRAAAIFAFFCLSAISAIAQQAPADQPIDGYKPPARFIAKETEKPQQKPATPAAPAVRTAPASPVSTVKTVGVISIVGETFTVTKVGTTGLSNEEQTFPMAGWKIDDKVAATVASMIKKNFKIKRIAIPTGAFKTFSEGEPAKFIAKYTAGHNCDYYILISPGGSELGNTNQRIVGLGVVRWEHVLFPGEYIHALSMITVYDSHMTQVRSEFATIGQGTFMASVKGPHQELKDDAKLPEDAKAAFADPRAQKIVWELMEKSLAMTVPKLLAAN